MTKVLIVNRNIQSALKDFQFLQNNGEYELITSNTGKETVEKCRTIKPSIIILDSNIADMNYPDIIDKISELPGEDNKCNLILTTANPKDKQLLKHTSILYEIFDSPFDAKQAKKTIDDLEKKYNTPTITILEVNNLLLKLGINIYSLGAQCLTSAIFKCYYHPEYFYTLDNIYSIVAEEYDITKEEVKNKIRHSIDAINRSPYINEQSLYTKIFGNSPNVSSKMFIQMFVNHLHTIKSKGN